MGAAGFDTIKIKAALLTDLEGTYQLPKGVRLSIGANNLFNHYPTKTFAARRAALLAATNSGYASSVYPTFSPYGINGGYYYARVQVNF